MSDSGSSTTSGHWSGGSDISTPSPPHPEGSPKHSSEALSSPPADDGFETDSDPFLLDEPAPRKRKVPKNPGTPRTTPPRGCCHPAGGDTGSICPPELGEGDVQVPVAELWQGLALHRRHQAARQDPAPGVRPKFHLFSLQTSVPWCRACWEPPIPALNNPKIIDAPHLCSRLGAAATCPSVQQELGSRMGNFQGQKRSGLVCAAQVCLRHRIRVWGAALLLQFSPQPPIFRPFMHFSPLLHFECSGKSAGSGCSGGAGRPSSAKKRSGTTTKKALGFFFFFSSWVNLRASPAASSAWSPRWCFWRRWKMRSPSFHLLLLSQRQQPTRCFNTCRQSPPILQHLPPPAPGAAFSPLSPFSPWQGQR